MNIKNRIIAFFILSLLISTTILGATNTYALDEEKIVPEIKDEIEAERINPGEVITNSSLTGSFVDPHTNLEIEGQLLWRDKDLVVDEPTRYTWIFIPDDDRYEEKTGRIELRPISFFIVISEILNGYYLPNLDIANKFEAFIDIIDDIFGFIFDIIDFLIDGSIKGLEFILNSIPSMVLIALLSILAWKLAGKGTGIFSIIGFLLINSMGYWEEAISTFSLVLVSAIIALIIGIPIGIWASKNNRVDNIVRPILDFMQTMPAFVYLIPAIMFFGLGQVPGAVATVIFSMPPVVRLTNLGIRQVPKNVVEAGISFGSTEKQMLFKVQLPIALPTILAGINQTIMLALSMVVISAMIGAGGLGAIVYSGVENARAGLGFEGGLAVVIVAMYLDRITQSLGKSDLK